MKLKDEIDIYLIEINKKYNDYPKCTPSSKIIGYVNDLIKEQK